MTLLARIKAYFTAKSTVALADATTEATASLFHNAVQGFATANDLYEIAEEELDDEIVELLADLEEAREERLSVRAAQKTNATRIAKLSEILG